MTAPAITGGDQGRFVLPATIARGAAARARGLSPTWPLTAMFVCYPIWWATGLANLSWPIIAIPIFANLAARRHLVVPRGFGLWLLFLTWALLSSTKLERASHYIAFSWRISLWVAALALLLYILNTPAARLPAEKVLHALLALWGATVVGGYLGLLLGERRLPTIARYVVPPEWADIDFIQNTIRPRFAQVQDWLGYPLPRPAAPFTFTNEWGANLAVLTLVLIAAWPTLRPSVRRLVGPLAVLSVVPMIISANRGLWLTLIGAFVYVTVRLTYRRDPRAARRLLGGILVTVLLVVATPLGSIITERLDSDHSNGARSTIYNQAIEGAIDSPLLGWGGPRANPLDPDLPPVGTHGTFWLVLFSHGFPGTVLFLGAMGSLVWRTSRPPPGDRQLLWLHGVVMAGFLMVPFYDLLPVPIYTVVACAALVLRDAPTVRAAEAAEAVRVPATVGVPA